MGIRSELAKRLRPRRVSSPTGATKEELANNKFSAIVHNKKSVQQGTSFQRKSFFDVEKLYYYEPLLFAGVNFYVNQVAGVGFDFIGKDEGATSLARQFAREMNLDPLLEKVVQDMCIFGNAFVELIRDEKGNVAQLGIVDPKTMDFIRDTDKRVLTDKIGNPIGYVQVTTTTTKEQKTELENILTANGLDLKNVDTSRVGIYFAAEEIAHYRLQALSDTLMGVGLVEPLFDTVHLKLKVEEALGKGLQKAGEPTYVATLGLQDDPDHWPTPQEVKDFGEKVFSNIQDMSDISKPYWIDVDVLEIPRIDRLKDYLNYFVDEIVTGLGIPHSIILRGEQIGSKAAAVQADNVERTIRAYQRNVAHTTVEQILKRALGKYDVTELPRMVFDITSPLTLSAQAEKLSMLARSGLLTPDRKTENEIRRIMKLPELPEETPTAIEEREKARKEKVDGNKGAGRSNVTPPDEQEG